MVIRTTPTKVVLTHIYDLCNDFFDKDCFYTEKELEQKKKEKDAKILKE